VSWVVSVDEAPKGEHASAATAVITTASAVTLAAKR
jgi:hypothetical protein